MSNAFFFWNGYRFNFSLIEFEAAFLLTFHIAFSQSFCPFELSIDVCLCLLLHTHLWLCCVWFSWKEVIKANHMDKESCSLKRDQYTLFWCL